MQVDKSIQNSLMIALIPQQVCRFRLIIIASMLIMLSLEGKSSSIVSVVYRTQASDTVYVDDLCLEWGYCRCVDAGCDARAAD